MSRVLPRESQDSRCLRSRSLTQTASGERPRNSGVLRLRSVLANGAANLIRVPLFTLREVKESQRRTAHSSELRWLPQFDDPSQPNRLPEIPIVPTSRAYLRVKRLMDILGSVLGLVLCGPVMIVCALLIKLYDGGPVLYCQQRVGERGRLFTIVKFRSMVVNADAIKDRFVDQNSHADDRTFKILNDPRITPVGRFMRRLSLDEVPQFWNVLQGEMSLVGPRPALPSEVALYDRCDLVRLAVRPGLTCSWQVSGRSKLDFAHQSRLDADYIRRRNLWLDMSLIVKTIPAVLRGEGAA